MRCEFSDRSPGAREGERPTAEPLAIGFRKTVMRSWLEAGDVTDTASSIRVLQGYFCQSCGMVV